MHRLIKISAVVLCFTACSPKIYRPPALGAEYRFNDGMKPPKHPSTLFDKKTTKDLEEKGILDKSTSAPASTASAVKTDSTGRTTRADSTRSDSLTIPVPASSPASSDSSHNGTN